MPCVHTATLFYHQVMISRLALQAVYFASGPVNHDELHPLVSSQADVQCGISGRLVATARAIIGILCHASGFEFHSSAKSIKIGTRAHGFDAKPVSTFLRLISQKDW